MIIIIYGIQKLKISGFSTHITRIKFP